VRNGGVLHTRGSGRVPVPPAGLPEQPGVHGRLTEQWGTVMTIPMKELEVCDFSDHGAGDSDCSVCESGYPRYCGCDRHGLIHAEIVRVEGDGYIQLTRCDVCGVPA